MHVLYTPNGLSGSFSGLGKFKKKRSRKDLAMDKLSAELEAAFALADSPEATEKDIKNAERLQAEYNAVVTSIATTPKRKKKGLYAALAKLKRKELLIARRLKLPGLKKDKRSKRKLRTKQIQMELLRVRGERPSPERNAKLKALSDEMMVIAKKEKKFMKQLSVIATIVSIVVGIFTFGAGGVAVQGAFQALKQGAIQIAKSILMAAIATAVRKGASKKDAYEATEVVNDLERYPPDPKLASLDAMLKDSQAKKLAAQEKRPGLLIPVGIIAALTLLR